MFNERLEVWPRRTITHKGLSLTGGVVLAAALLAACGDDSVADQSGATRDTADTVVTLLPNSRHREVQQFGADSFSDYDHATGMGEPLPVGAEVDVDCLAVGPEAAAPSAHGRWYHIIGPDPWTDFYVAANTFENGDVTGPLSEQPAVDPDIPTCPEQ